MSVRTAIWTVGSEPLALPAASLTSERELEEMIAAAPRLLSEEWMLIGRQESTGLGGRIDLLAAAPDGSLVLIELKRDRTPREVTAQALDYASWVEGLSAGEIAAIYGRFAPGRDLAQDFRKHFGQDLNEDSLNQSHQIVVAAASLDDSTERIVRYLSDHGIPINVLCFQVFAYGSERLLSRTWLIDPMRAQISAATPIGDAEPWNGEFYCSFGHGPSRSWEDATQYGFVSAGGGAWYSRTLQLLTAGDRVWVRVPRRGFVGVGRVVGTAQAAKDFIVVTENSDASVLDIANRATYHREFIDDPERSEYFVPIRWLQTVPLEHAVDELGLFGNQNSVCKPTTPQWRSTVDRLKQRFVHFDRES